jgi:glucosamine--fructose-6-phosphate aminotransferase (isomerizing)
MELEISQQVDVLAAGSQSYFNQIASALSGKSFDMVLIAARGSSDNAALYARYLIEILLGIPVSLAAPSVITQHNTNIRFPKCLTIGISQSGAAPDVAEVLSFMRSKGHETLAITNTPDSRLTKEAASCLLLECEQELSVAATKTYTASLLAIYELVRALGGSLEPPAGRTPDAAWMEKTLEAAHEAQGPVVRQHVLFSLGRGFGFATCQESALKLMECALLPCKAYSTADFQHGPKALAGPESAAIIYGETPTGLVEQGCIPIVAPVGPSGPIGSIWEIAFGQWLALLAARARGLNPDAPRNLTKVTLTH